MNTPDLLVALKQKVGEVSDLKMIPEGFRNPRVKAWKTSLEDVLDAGGSTCQKALNTLRKIKNSVGGSDFIKTQTYVTQMEALERTVKQTIQCIELLGRPEDRKLPKWGKPKSQHLAVGHLKVGDTEISTESITIRETLKCLTSLAEDSNDLSKEMRDQVINHLAAILDDELLQPFLGRGLDVLLGHWPEFSGKSTA